MALSTAKALSRSKEANLEDFRFERKFLITELTKHQIESIVLINPAMFSEIYHQRYINNIYLDTVNMSNYFDNVDGLNSRLKVRIRWYGDLLGKVSKPVLELKIKDGLLGTKQSFKLKEFTMDENFNAAELQNIFAESDLPDYLREELKNIKFTLLNRYGRTYYRSACTHFRITIDSDLSYYKLNPLSNTFAQSITDNHSVVLELKYANDKDDIVDKITNYFPFRLSKNSKYINGVDYLNYQ